MLTVNDNPTADAGTDESICNGESVTLTASGGDTYEVVRCTDTDDVQHLQWRKCNLDSQWRRHVCVV